MTSASWNDNLAARYHQFQYEIPEHPLKDHTVVVAGGTVGLTLRRDRG